MSFESIVQFYQRNMAYEKKLSPTSGVLKINMQKIIENICFVVLCRQKCGVVKLNSMTSLESDFSRQILRVPLSPPNTLTPYGICGINSVENVQTSCNVGDYGQGKFYYKEVTTTNCVNFLFFYSLLQLWLSFFSIVFTESDSIFLFCSSLTSDSNSASATLIKEFTFIVYL